jgi:S1-C subfamily serine protease
LEIVLIGCQPSYKITSVYNGVKPAPPSISLEDLLRQVELSVVAINITAEEKGKEGLYIASGFLIAKDIVVTNQHVVKGNVKKIMVLWDSRLGKKPIEASIGLVDSKYDLALLKLSEKVDNFLQLEEKEVRLGEGVFLLGFPDTAETEDGNIKYLHVFKGIIASVHPSQWILDIRVLRGNSGGPVVSAQTGKVVGVVTEVILDSEQESVKLPSGKVQEQSVEGESVGAAVPSLMVSTLWKKYQKIGSSGK